MGNSSVRVADMTICWPVWNTKNVITTHHLFLMIRSMILWTSEDRWFIFRYSARDPVFVFVQFLFLTNVFTNLIFKTIYIFVYLQNSQLSHNFEHKMVFLNAFHFANLSTKSVRNIYFWILF